MSTDDLYAPSLEERLRAEPTAKLEDLQGQLELARARLAAAEAVCHKLASHRKDSRADLTCTAPAATVDELLVDWEREVARQGAT